MTGIRSENTHMSSSLIDQLNQDEKDVVSPAMAGDQNPIVFSEDAQSNNAGEEAWIEVIQKMDSMYAELVESQVALESKHEELNRAHNELNMAQKRLVQSEKMAALGRLVAGVAHELNNPISFVFGNMHALKTYGEKITTYLQAVQQHGDNPALKHLRNDLKIDRIMNDIMPLVEGTLEGAERVSDIVQELRSFSSTQKREAKPFSVLPVLQTAVNWVLKAENEAPKIDILCRQDFTIISRKGHIHQILVNLLQNAVDVLRDVQDATIIVECSMTQEQICISVTDNGSGISKKNHDSIFEPFFTTKPVGKGTGLGLYVSYNMAQELGGRLRLNRDFHDGAKFEILLPISNIYEEKKREKLDHSLTNTGTDYE